MANIPLSCIVFLLNNARIAKHHTVTGHITVYKAIRRDQHIVTDGNVPHDSCVDPDPYGIPNGGRALARASVFLPDGNALVNIAILAYHRSRVYRDIIRMPQIQSFPNIAAVCNFDSSPAF